MARPRIEVRVYGALPRRGSPTATGTAFMAFSGATGPTTPVRCTTAEAASIAFGAASPIVPMVAACLYLGAPEVILAPTAAVAPDAVTLPEWTAGLAALSDEFGGGQVLIPGVTTAASSAAILAHVDANKGRSGILDAPAGNAAAIVAAATALAEIDGAERSTMIAPSVTVPSPGNTTRLLPGSVAAAGLAARGDAFTGHSNNAPAGDQGRNAGLIVVQRSSRKEVTTATYTNAELDSLNNAGVSVIRQMQGLPTLYGWSALSRDPQYLQFNWGRFTAQLYTGIYSLMEQFLFQQIDGRGRLFAKVEGALKGYLLDMWNRDALYGDIASDAFEVQVASVNTAATISLGELHAALRVQLSPHTEAIFVDVVTQTDLAGLNGTV